MRHLNEPWCEPPVRYIHKERRCHFRNCKTPLSGYNYSDYCSIHDPIMVIKQQNRFLARVGGQLRKGGIYATNI
jgi:hypothetical protein